MRPFRYHAVMLLSLIALGARAACPQDAVTGALSGVVHDASGAVIVGASLALADSSGTMRYATSDRLGEFFLPALPPGHYRIRITANGFGLLQIDRADIAVGQALRIDPELTNGIVSETVEVFYGKDLPGFDSPVDASLSPADLQLLPLDGRRFQQFASLTPLVSSEDATPDDADVSGIAADADNARLSFRGIAPSQNLYVLDGEDLTRAFDGEPRGGRVLPFTVPLDAVQEFQVRASVTGTTLGRDAGGSVTTVTRRGEADPHGSIFFLLRNSGTGAANPFAVATRYNGGQPTTTAVKPRDQREQFGGSVGGPLLPRHLFGFVAAEGQRRSFPAIASPSDPAFYSLSAVQTALLANRGVGATATARALTFLDSLTGTVPRHADEFALLPRLDWQQGSRSTLTAHFSHVRFRSPSGQRSEPVLDRGRASTGDVLIHTDSGLLRATWALSTRWLMEAHAAYSRDASFAQLPPPLAAEPRTGPGDAAPQISIADAFTFGSSAALGARRLPDERATEFAAHSTFNGRAQTITLGANIKDVDERIGAREASSGAYDYTSGVTNGRAGGLVDFITDYTYSATSYPNGGCPSIYAAVHLFCFRSFTQTFGAVAETRFHTASLSVFAGDGWRVTPHLRIDAGVRYEYLRLPPAQHPNAALDAAFGVAATTSTMPSDTNDLAPHLGIAYAASTRTMMRVSYGIHFGSLPGRTLQRLLEDTAQAGSQASLRLTPRTIIDPACASAGTNFGYPATFTCSPFGPLASAGAAMMISRTFQLPAIQRGELSITRELAARTTISATYVVSFSRQLPNTTDLNIAPSTAKIAFRILRAGSAEPGARNGDVFNVPRYTARVTDAFGPVTALLSNGNGSYNALALQFDRRASAGVTLRASWTYSKALDNLRSTSAAPDEDAQFDPVQPLYDRAASNFNHTHRVVSTAVWQPLLHAQSDIARAVINGWSLAPVFVAQSGRPYSYNLSGGTELAGGRETLNGSGGATYLPSVGRNTLRLPWSATVDLRLARTLAASDRTSLRLSAEAFNLLNHVNPTAVEQRAFLVGAAGADGILPLIFQDAGTIASEGLTGKPFGTLTSSAASPTRERRLQFGLRYEW
ncbi:TonB-dependent receptor [Terriglobus roseus]|uniref:Carboxypeptidase regulatory-like domain-containing protein n=1 Tax=Terriglobus roseus TaxID=392734 RepID=A0A1H4N4V9_9BACT|nr:carboxypeptidase-like regulatory domain-containing protein [Terriglobus roseus]SEB89785.1 Carboxypeptidase regulatory-like domain-containing protein [Terriglobus roseus]